MRQDTSALENAIKVIDDFLKQIKGHLCKEIERPLMALGSAAAGHYRNIMDSGKKQAFNKFCGHLGVTHPLKETRYNVSSFRTQFQTGELQLDDIDQLLLGILERVDEFFRKSFLRMQLIEIFTTPVPFNHLEDQRTLSTKELEALKSEHPGFCPEALQLMVLHKKSKLSKNGIAWDCDVLKDLNELAVAIDELLGRELLAGETHRKQIIFPIWLHYITIDIEVFHTEEGNKFRISYFDSTQDWKSKPYINMFKKLPMVTDFYNMVEVAQNDLISCPMNAFETAKALRKTDNLYRQLEQISDEKKEFKLSDLHPCFYKNLQSITKIRSKPGNDIPFNKHGENLLQYLARHQGFFSDYEPNKARNFSVYDKFLKAAKAILPLLNKMSDDDLHQILSGEKSLESLADIDCDEGAQKVAKVF